MNINKKLTKTERTIAVWLARGKSPATICTQLCITESTLRVHISHIRRKTDIKDLEPQIVQSYLERTNEVRYREQALTQNQKAVLQMVAKYSPYAEIGKTLGISSSAAMNRASQGCKRLGITGDRYTRVAAIRKALKMDGNSMDDPMFQ